MGLLHSDLSTHNHGQRRGHTHGSGRGQPQSVNPRVSVTRPGARRACVHMHTKMHTCTCMHLHTRRALTSICRTASSRSRMASRASSVISGSSAGSWLCHVLPPPPKIFSLSASSVTGARGLCRGQTQYYHGCLAATRPRPLLLWLVAGGSTSRLSLSSQVPGTSRSLCAPLVWAVGLGDLPTGCQVLGLP